MSETKVVGSAASSTANTQPVNVAAALKKALATETQEALAARVGLSRYQIGLLVRGLAPGQKTVKALLAGGVLNKTQARALLGVG